MNTLRSIYMPFRRVFLDDDEVPHQSDVPWLIGMPAITVASWVVCFTSVAGS